MKNVMVFVFSVFCLLVFCNGAHAEEVFLKDGSVLYGQILENEKNSNKIKVIVYSEVREIPKKSIKRIKKLEGRGSSNNASPTNTKAGSLGAASVPLPEITPEEALKQWKKRLELRKEEEKKEKESFQKED